MNMDWVALDPKHSNRTIHRAGVTRVMLTPTSLDWEAGQQVGMQQVTPDVPMHLSLTDDRLQEDEFISSKPEMSREITRLRQLLATATEERDELQVLHANQKKSIELYQQQLATVTAERDAYYISMNEAHAEAMRDKEALATVRREVWEEAAIYWDTAAEGPCKDGDDFAWACRVAQWCRDQARKEQP